MLRSGPIVALLERSIFAGSLMGHGSELHMGSRSREEKGCFVAGCHGLLTLSGQSGQSGDKKKKDKKKKENLEAWAYLLVGCLQWSASLLHITCGLRKETASLGRGSTGSKATAQSGASLTGAGKRGDKFGARTISGRAPLSKRPSERLRQHLNPQSTTSARIDDLSIPPGPLSCRRPANPPEREPYSCVAPHRTRNSCFSVG